MTDENDINLMQLTTSIVSAYVAANSIPSASLPDFIASVHAALSNIGEPAVVENEKPVPAVPIKKSITPDYLFSLFDGKPYKSLRRHLKTSHGMTPDQYREHFSLPDNYPMVSENYSMERSALAKQLGLGRKPAPAPVEEPVKVMKVKRGRPAKAKQDAEAV